MGGDAANERFVDNRGAVKHIGSVNKAAERKSHTKSPNSIAGFVKITERMNYRLNPYYPVDLFQ